MNKVVWKYPLAVDGRAIEGLEYPRVVHVGIDPADGFTPCAWVEHQPDEKAIREGLDLPGTILRLEIFGTGHPVPHFANHVGTAIQPDGLVWHVYAWVAK